MKLVFLLLIASLFSYQVRAGEDKVALCAKQPDSSSCISKTCHWHIGYCLPVCDCTEFSPEECTSNPECQFSEVDNGFCSNIGLGCEYYDNEQCTANSVYCNWTPYLVCLPLPGYNPSCPSLNGAQCQAQAELGLCSYTAQCVNNDYPSNVWDLCKDACLENPFGTWETFKPAYCIDNTSVCEQYSIDECKCHTDICAIERIYNCNDQTTYSLNQCSNPNGFHFTEKCKALTYDCEDKCLDDCKCDPLCKVVDEIGQCYPVDLPNCNTLEAGDCLNYPNCCLKETCTNLPGAGEECRGLTVEQCGEYPQCYLVDQGNCSDKPFDCSLNQSKCLKHADFCLWTPDVTAYCSNVVNCHGLSYEDCKENCDVCDWQRETCKHHP